MSKFNTSLLRERFIITDTMPGAFTDSTGVIALSNRLVLPLFDSKGNLSETLIVRAQNMHICARMAAKVVHDFLENGPITKRKEKKFNFSKAYKSITEGFEAKWNPHCWASVYHNGKAIFSGGKESERHPFLDIIENCDAKHPEGYERSLEVAERIFKQAGKTVKIEHEANVAAIINYNGGEARCGIILRGADKTTTFNFNVLSNKSTRQVKFYHCLSASAAYLEAIQLAFYIGMTNTKLHYELIKKHSSEITHRDEAKERLTDLIGAIDQFENLFSVSYHPEKPDLKNMVGEAEDYAHSIFSEEIDQKIVDSDESKWIV